MRRRVALLATSFLLILAAAAAAVVSAQEPPPTVTITVGPRSVSVAGAENLSAGPTRIEIRGNPRIEGILAALKPGRTLQELRRALPRAQNGPGPLKPIVSFEATGAPPRGGAYATTIDLRPGVTYVAGNVPPRIRNVRFATFTVGTTTSTAVRPTPVATVGVYDYAYGMPSVLPRSGVIRFENRGERLHIAIAFPIRRARDSTRAVRALLRNQERRFNRLIVGRRAFEALGVVSPGTVNDVEVNFGRPGRWVFTCFVEDGEPGSPPHYTIGMVKPFRVR
jgi:hypothetical protein